MGYMMVLGNCIACKRPISFNAQHVPSIRVNGVREPLCKPCFERWCKLHPDQKVTLHPDAYSPEECE